MVVSWAMVQYMQQQRWLVGYERNSTAKMNRIIRYHSSWLPAENELIFDYLLEATIYSP